MALEQAPRGVLWNFEEAGARARLLQFVPPGPLVPFRSAPPRESDALGGWSGWRMPVRVGEQGTVRGEICVERRDQRTRSSALVHGLVEVTHHARHRTLRLHAHAKTHHDTRNQGSRQAVSIEAPMARAEDPVRGHQASGFGGPKESIGTCGSSGFFAHPSPRLGTACTSGGLRA